MKRLNFLVYSMLLLSGSLLSVVPVWGAEGVIAKVPSAPGDYCHMKFPAIREETLSWDRPVLKDASSGDIIDFYGPCNYDPLGKVEVAKQKTFAWERRRLPEDRY